MLQLELANNKCTPERLEVWQRGVDTVRFNPSYKCEAMRATLTDGHPEAPLLVHVGRLGAGVFTKTLLVPGLHAALAILVCRTFACSYGHCNVIYTEASEYGISCLLQCSHASAYAICDSPTALALYQPH